MANSKKIYLPITILLIIGLVLSANEVLMDAYRYHYRKNYLAAIIDKNNLLATTPSPKIIIVGGSNAAFGFDSKAISEATGMPVVNMGIQGSIGLRFALNDIKPYIHSGDIVLLSPEYHNLMDELHGGDVLSYVLIFDPKGIANISSLHDAYEVIKSFPAVHTSAIKTTLDLKLREKCDFLCKIDEQVYYRAAFDPDTGDILTNPVKPDTLGDSEFTFDWSVPNNILNQNVRFVNDFNAYAESQGASMLYVYPSISDDFTAEVLSKLESTSKFLEEHLDFPVLGTLEDSFFAEQYMFDTVYHLNNVGREIRTKTVIRDLCAMLEDQCAIQP